MRKNKNRVLGGFLLKMNKERINKDFELIKSLYFGNHISERDLKRLKIVVLGLKMAMDIKLKEGLK